MIDRGALKSTFWLGIGGAIAIHAPAHAQQTGAALDEIVVTAQRRTENLQRTPIAVSVVGGEELTSRGITQVSELTQLVPALRADTGAGPYNAMGIRGVATTALNAFADPAVAVNLDSVYLPRPWSAQALFFDVERVEVLKGPQGTLYGRNATGGAINVVTRTPDFDSFAADLTAEIGNYDMRHLSGGLNFPLAESAALRAAFQVIDRGGYFSDGTSDEDQKAVRLSFRAEPSDRLAIAIRGDYAELGGMGNGATAYCIGGLPVGATNPNTPGRSCSPTGEFYGDPWTGITTQAAAIYPAVLPTWTNNDFVPDAFVPAVPLYSSPYQDDEFWTLSAQIDVAIGQGGTLSLIPASRHEDIDFLSAGGFVIHEANTTDQDTFEVRFVSDDSRRVRYIVGAYALEDSHTGNAQYDAQGLFTPPPVNLFPPAPNLQSQHTDNEGSSHAVFGNVTFDLTDSVRLNLGARATYDEKSTRSDDGAIPYYVPVPGASPPSGPAVVGPGGYLLFPPVGGTAIVFATAGTKSWREDDWKVGIEWDVADGTLLYASAATGFKSGGFFFSPVPSVDSFSYRPEDLLAYTLGSKSQFLDDRLQLNLELFDWDYEDQQVAALALIPPFIIFPQQNAEQSSITGVEAELRYLIADSTLLSFGAQLTEAKYDKFTLISAFPAAHCVTVAAGPPLVLDCSGNKLLNTPDTTVTLGVRHTFSLSAGGSLVLGVDARYESERLAGYNSYAVVEPNTRTDVRLAYESPGSWSLEAFVDNVTDEVVPIGVGASINLIPGLYSTGLRPPRTYGLRLALHF